MKAPPRLREHRICWTAEEKAIVLVVWARTRTKERMLPGLARSFSHKRGMKAHETGTIVAEARRINKFARQHELR